MTARWGQLRLATHNSQDLEGIGGSEENFTRLSVMWLFIRQAQLVGLNLHLRCDQSPKKKAMQKQNRS